MTGLDVLRAVVRHPAVFVACMVAALFGCATVWYGVPTNYSAQDSLVLLSPEVITTQDGQHVRVNPWQQVGDNASQVTASALASIGNSQEFQNQLATSGVTSKTAVAVSLAGGGVVLDVVATNRVSASASHDLGIVVSGLRDALAQQQRDVGAPSGSFLRAVELTAPGDPVPLTGSRTKLAGITGVLGLIISLVAVSLVEGRRRRRQPVASRASRARAAAVPQREATREDWDDYHLPTLRGEDAVPARSGDRQRVRDLDVADIVTPSDANGSPRLSGRSFG